MIILLEDQLFLQLNTKIKFLEHYNKTNNKSLQNLVVNFSVEKN